MSHPVRRIREDPIPDESVTLVVELADGDHDRSDDDERAGAADGCSGGESFCDAVAALGGEITAELQFDSYRVSIPQTAVDDLCSLGGLAVVETAGAVGHGGDAGEDVGI